MECKSVVCTAGTIQTETHAEDAKAAAERSHNHTRTTGFNAKGAEAFTKAAKKIASAFLCDNLCFLCVKKSSRN